MVVFVHQIRAMITFGIAARVAGTIAASSAVVGLAGRYCLGWLADFVRSRYLLGLALGLQATGVILLSFIEPGSTLLIGAFIALFGIGQGGIFLLAPLIQKEYFGVSSFGTIQGLLIGASMVISAITPVFVGSFVDAYGTYRPVFSTAGLIGLGLTVLILLNREPKVSTATASLTGYADSFVKREP
jgi:MFS family permease